MQRPEVHRTIYATYRRRSRLAQIRLRHPRNPRPLISAPITALFPALRARRQQLLHNGTCTLHLIIDHTALHQPIVPAPTMAAQIKHLAAITSLPAVTIQITAHLPAHPVLSPSFTLLSSGDSDQPAIACYHGPAGQILTTRHADATRTAHDTFQTISRTALTPARSADLITHHAHTT